MKHFLLEMLGKASGAYSLASTRDREEGLGREGGKIKLFCFCFEKRQAVRVGEAGKGYSIPKFSRSREDGNVVG